MIPNDVDLLIYDCQSHGDPNLEMADIRRLLLLALTLHRAPGQEHAREQIETVAKRLGAVGTIFSDDPPGTVKLKFSDGCVGPCVPIPDENGFFF